VEMAFPAIVKKSGARVDFDPAKLRGSMTLALRKRQVSIEQVDGAIERIQERLLACGEREVPTTRIGELVLGELKHIDKVAYVRFASVYRSFEDVDEFSRLIRDI
jgi:transcriptional repressor NrdR